ncbi:hypothetical protein Nmel_012652 [Mimus melanotis]
MGDGRKSWQPWSTGVELGQALQQWMRGKAVIKEVRENVMTAIIAEGRKSRSMAILDKGKGAGETVTQHLSLKRWWLFQ